MSSGDTGTTMELGGIGCPANAGSCGPTALGPSTFPRRLPTPNLNMSQATDRLTYRATSTGTRTVTTAGTAPITADMAGTAAGLALACISVADSADIMVAAITVAGITVEAIMAAGIMEAEAMVEEVITAAAEAIMAVDTTNETGRVYARSG